MKTTNPIHSYKETQVKTATQSKLIIMLYDGAVKFINKALENLAQKHTAFDKMSNNILRAQDIITELMASLNFEKGGEIAKNLFNLYMYMNKRLIEANIKKSATPLEEVKKLLTELRSAWAEVAQRNIDEPGIKQTTGINIAG